MYAPADEILEKYAQVLINFALGGGKGIKPREVVYIQIPECAKPLLVPLRRAVLAAGGFPMIHYMPDDIARDFYETANDEQLAFFPGKFLKGRVDQIDHLVSIIADTNLHELEGIDPKKLMTTQKASKPYKKWLDEKEYAGRFTWSLALFGTSAMAKEAKMPLKAYWEQIIKGCYLDEKDPVAKWKAVAKEVHRVRDTLNKLKIEKLHIEAKDTDLIVGLGPERKWCGCDGRNIPSFEVFTSPNWRETQGKIYFNEPLYRYGNLIQDVKLEFKNGKVVMATAKKGQKVLQEMIKAQNADKIGEYSLTDSRLSRITKFMAETLFDENVGGKYGNTHLALGSSYKDCYIGNPAKVSPAQWKQMGYNDSVVHTDIIATTNRTVTAYLPGGKKKIIYRDGKFVV